MTTPFIKTILPSSYDYGEPTAALVDIHSHGVDSQWMNKRAAAGMFNDLDIKPEKDHSYIHLIAMGDSEFYGQNRNGDAFLKKGQVIHIPNPADGKTHEMKINVGNVETYPTFEKYAKVYRHHVNKDPEKAHGDVHKAAHNDAMSRVELMIRVANDGWANELQKLASGEDVAFSMSCKVPYDVCSECGNKARNRTEYCDHLKNHMGDITKSGHQIGAINDNMLYFDISQVTVPADRIAFGLLKAASDNSRLMSGSELADELTLFPPVDTVDLLGGATLDKLAAIGKLSEIEKEIEMVGTGASNNDHINKCMMAFGPETFKQSLNDSELAALNVPSNEVPDILGALTDAKITLSVKDFLRIVMGRRFNDVSGSVCDAENMLPGIFGRLAAKPHSMLSGLDDFELGSGLIPRKARDIISELVPGMSLADDPMGKRVTITILRGNSKPEFKIASFKKEGSASPLAERIATVYAMYKLAACQRMGLNDRVLMQRALLQHYI